MTYTYAEPIIDRSQQNVDDRAHKAFFNVTDWTRIYQNALYVNHVYYAVLNVVIPFDALADQTIDSIPSVTDFNILLANINRICAQVNLTGLLGLTLQKDNWTAGTEAETFNYTNVNEWEAMLAKMLDLARFIASDLVSCGVGSAGQARFYQFRWRSYKWVENSVTPTYKPRLHSAICGRSFARQNSYRRY